jgi:hypothetical protein
LKLMVIGSGVALERNGSASVGVLIVSKFPGVMSMASKRELIEPQKGDKRFVRRDEKGRFKQVVDVGRSLAADRRQRAKTVAKPGQGDKGDRSR